MIAMCTCLASYDWDSKPDYQLQLRTLRCASFKDPLSQLLQDQVCQVTQPGEIGLTTMRSSESTSMAMAQEIAASHHKNGGKIAICSRETLAKGFKCLPSGTAKSATYRPGSGSTLISKMLISRTRVMASCTKTPRLRQRSDEEKLWDSGVLNQNTSQGLLNCVFFLNN